MGVGLGRSRGTSPLGTRKSTPLRNRARRCLVPSIFEPREIRLEWVSGHTPLVANNARFAGFCALFGTLSLRHFLSCLFVQFAY